MDWLDRISRSLLARFRDVRGVSLFEITAAVAMTAILAAVAVPMIADKVTEAKATRTAQETEAIYGAMTAFHRDTGKMPGQAEGAVLLVSSVSRPLPDLAPGVLDRAGITVTGDQRCSAYGQSGDAPSDTPKCFNLNQFLVTVPRGNYPNWRGPYIDMVTDDPFDRSYIVNVRPLYEAGCSGPAGSAGFDYGFGWVLSGGPDRLLATSLAVTKLDAASDDIGRNNGKKVGPSACASEP